MQWGNILLAEIIFTGLVLVVFGFVKLPAFLHHRRLIKGFPWGYYTNAIPRVDPGYAAEHDLDFLHDVTTEFAGMDNLSESGQFSGFGEQGEYGNTFFGGEF
jgi:hypothetical protein